MVRGSARRALRAAGVRLGARRELSLLQPRQQKRRLQGTGAEFRACGRHAWLQPRAQRLPLCPRPAPPLRPAPPTRSSGQAPLVTCASAAPRVSPAPRPALRPFRRVRLLSRRARSRHPGGNGPCVRHHQKGIEAGIGPDVGPRRVPGRTRGERRGSRRPAATHPSEETGVRSPNAGNLSPWP